MKYVIDPNNPTSPISKNNIEDFYNQVSLGFGPEQASLMFIKGSGLGTFPATGSLKTMTEQLKAIIETNKSGDSLFFQRDLVLRFANLLLCDGFAAKQPPSPAVIKLAIELMDSVTQMMSGANQQYNTYDIECGLLVIVGRFEQFNPAVLKIQLMKCVEDFAYQCAKLIDVSEYIIANLMGKSMRYAIRQVPTRISIVRFCLGAAVMAVQRGQLFELSISAVSNLIGCHQQFGVETMALTDCGLVANIPVKLSQARQIVVHLLQIVFNHVSPEMRQRIQPLIAKACGQDSHTIFSPVSYLAQDTTNVTKQKLQRTMLQTQIAEP